MYEEEALYPWQKGHAQGDPMCPAGPVEKRVGSTERLWLKLLVILKYNLGTGGRRQSGEDEDRGAKDTPHR